MKQAYHRSLHTLSSLLALGDCDLYQRISMHHKHGRSPSGSPCSSGTVAVRTELTEIGLRTVHIGAGDWQFGAHYLLELLELLGIARNERDSALPSLHCADNNCKSLALGADHQRAFVFESGQRMAWWSNQYPGGGAPQVPPAP